MLGLNTVDAVLKIDFTVYLNVLPVAGLAIHHLGCWRNSSSEKVVSVEKRHGV